MRLKNAQNSRTCEEPNEAEERGRTFVLDTAQSHGIILFLTFNVSLMQYPLQCCASTTLFFKNLFVYYYICLLLARIAAILYASGWFV